MHNICECGVSIQKEGIQVTDQQLLSQFQAILNEQYATTLAQCIASNSEVYVKMGSNTLMVKGVNATKSVLFYQGSTLLVSFRYVGNDLKSIWIGYGSPIVTMDMDVSGRRLEGVLENKTVAKGTVFNDINRISYCGTVVNNKRHGFGVSFFEDIGGNHIHLIGFFHEDEPDGIALELSRRDAILRAGVWSVGRFLPSLLRIDEGISFDRLHSGVKEVVIATSAPLTKTIGSFLSQSPGVEKVEIEPNSLSSLDSLRLADFSQLRTIIIGDHVMTNKRSNFINENQLFSLQNLPSLEMLHIGSDSLTCCKDFSITHCDRLREIEIGVISNTSSAIPSSFFHCCVFSLQRTF